MNPFTDKRPYFGQDPFVFEDEGVLFYVESQNEARIILRELESLEDLHQAKTRTIWDDPTDRQVWAPEIHEIDGWWYLYYTASRGDNESHRMFVAEAETPYGPYEDKYQLGPDIWGIDMTVFAHHGEFYAAWSGWEQNGDGFPQHLYVAQMPGPYNLRGRMRVSSPEYQWEKSIAPINEGPQTICSPEGRLFLSYSANASWTQDYCVGLLELIGENPLNPSDWYKHPHPLKRNAGHGCFLPSKEDLSKGLYVQHRKQSALPGWADREIRTTPYAWDNGKPLIK